MAEKSNLSELGKFFLGASFQPTINRNLKRELCRFWVEGNQEEMFEILRRVDSSSLKRGIAEAELADKHEIVLLTFDDPRYPKRLRQIPDPPLVLFVWGGIPDAEFVVAIVGTRRATPYGKRHAFRLAREVTACGGVVVSGLAYGIDKAAHEGAVESFLGDEQAVSAGVSVLGSGLLSIYPKQHLSLAASVAKHSGAVISEYPLLQEPREYTFPERNRIISGLSDAVVVIEAQEKSGALITARCALEQGREVFSLPGPVESKGSAGPHRLLREGAFLVSNLSDIFEAIPRLKNTGCYQQAPKDTLKEEKGEEKKSEAQALSIFNAEERSLAKQIVSFLQQSDLLQFDLLVEQVKAEPTKLQALLSELELQGVVFSKPGQFYSLSEFVET